MFETASHWKYSSPVHLKQTQIVSDMLTSDLMFSEKLQAARSVAEVRHDCI